jgi:hypothetical protein
MVISFLPYADFQKTAEVLDMRRLGSSKNEAKIMINTLLGKSKGWASHPATLSYVGHVDALKLYFNIILQEWLKRGYNSEMKFFDLSDHLKVKSKLPKKFRPLCKNYKIQDYDIEMPWFIGNDDYHYSHQAMLYRKKPDFYKFDYPTKFNTKGYYWPKANKTFEIYSTNGKYIETLEVINSNNKKNEELTTNDESTTNNNKIIKKKIKIIKPKIKAKEVSIVDDTLSINNDDEKIITSILNDNETVKKRTELINKFANQYIPDKYKKSFTSYVLYMHNDSRMDFLNKIINHKNRTEYLNIMFDDDLNDAMNFTDNDEEIIVIKKEQTDLYGWKNNQFSANIIFKTFIRKLEELKEKNKKINPYYIKYTGIDKTNLKLKLTENELYKEIYKGFLNNLQKINNHRLFIDNLFDSNYELQL